MIDNCEKINQLPKKQIMKWYLAKIVFQIICGDGKHTAQFDEQLRLIAAADEDEAFGKTLPKISASHMFFEMELKELKDLRDHAMKKIRTDEKASKS